MKKFEKLLVAILIVLLTAGGALSLRHAGADVRTTDELKAEAAKLQEKIEDNENQAKKLAKKARSLKNAIAILDGDIKQISNKIKLLEKELAIAQTKLDYHRGLLLANMRALYRRSGASTIEVLAASDSISEFIDEQEYLDRLKGSVQESTEEVLAIKLDIQTKKYEQEVAREELEEKRADRAELLAETKGSEKKYRERIRKLTKKQRKINRELAKHSEVLELGGGPYPWKKAKCAATDKLKGNCPDFEWYRGEDKDNTRDKWGYFYRNCTSYVAWRSAKKGLTLAGDGYGMGDGGQWLKNAKLFDLETGKKPKKGAFAVWKTGGYGHVAYVEDVVGANIVVSEMNFVVDGVYSVRKLAWTQPTGYIYTPWSK